jgi:hypothetical protein
MPIAPPSPSPARADRIIVQPAPPTSADDAREPARGLSPADGEATWEMALVLELAEPPPKPDLTPAEMAAQ